MDMCGGDVFLLLLNRFPFYRFVLNSSCNEHASKRQSISNVLVVRDKENESKRTNTKSIYNKMKL